MGSDPVVASDRAVLLAKAGVRRAVVEIQWQDVDPARPAEIAPTIRTAKASLLSSAVSQGLRPLLLLDAYHAGPRRLWTLNVTSPAAAGDRQIQIDAASTAQVTAGLSGLMALESGNVAEVLITAVDAGGRATLSKPLPVTLAGGPHGAFTFAFAPFHRPQLPDGSPDPAFESTLTGFSDFFDAATGLAQTAAGKGAFDVVIFNGVSSPFLDVEKYYQPPLPGGQGDVLRAILERTVARARDPSLGLGAMAIIDGFSDLEWSDTGSTETPGIQGMSRLLGIDARSFPSNAPLDARWIDAEGNPNGAASAGGGWVEAFTPTYTAEMPELALTALTASRMSDDLAPFLRTDATGVTRGRDAHPAGSLAPSTWITAFSLRPPDAVMTRGDIARFQSKAIMRALSAYVGKGAETLFIYEGDRTIELVDDKDPTGGEGARAVARFLASFDTVAAPTMPRTITLSSVASCSSAAEFDGDGTPAHPSLLHREIVGFFPFQLEDRRFVISTYVMTRDMSRVRNTAADASRFDLPPETFVLSIEGLDGLSAQASAIDPLTGVKIAVRIVSRGSNTLVLELPLTDSPRLLDISG